MRAIQAGPATGLIAQVALLAALAGTVGLGAAGWVVGVACAVIVNAALARGLSRHGGPLGPAGWVTLARATLAVGVAALTADAFDGPAAVTTMVTLAVVALSLDAVDGWVARRTGTASPLGARFDGEVDAFLILVLSVYLAPSAGAWVLAIGAARYAFLAAGWLLPWMREPLPPRHWRKVVAGTQGIVLTIAAADVLPSALTTAALVVALALLAESFGRDTWWLWAHRHAAPSREAAVSDQDPGLGASTHDEAGRGRARSIIGVALTVLALLLVWIALVAPNQPSHLTPGAFVRLPLDGLVALVALVVLPARARRVAAWVAGAALGLLVLVKIADMGFYAAFDRPFDPVADLTYTGIGIETMRDSIGRTATNLAIAGVVALIVSVLVLTTLAVRRVTRVAADNRRVSLRAVTALGVVSVLCLVFGARLVSDAPIASASAADLTVHKVRAVRAGIRDHAVFADEIANDRFGATPGDRLLTALRGKDVVVAFVESYGKVAVQGSSFSPRIEALLDRGTKGLEAAGFSSRSAFLTSPTFGGISWLAHSTLQAGVWVNTQRRYDQLVASDRLTLATAFKRAGWRTVDDVPANNRSWTPGSAFYRYDRVYDQRTLGYRGPRFGYPPMPDQYVLMALHRLELAKPARRPVFAEVDLVSSHEPWTRIPRLIDWDEVGDGSIFHRIPVARSSPDIKVGNLVRNLSALMGDSEEVRTSYGRSIEYTLRTVFSFVRRYGDDDLVLVVLGDHQPWGIVSGLGASHDVPVSVIARDPAVLHRIAGWGWEDGMRPGPQAPVWPMNAFRDRFLRAFGSQPAPR